mmetsp:Transcript_53640/g.127808  ORF Transcript_53640/g.127808 Transcript_53640/m.127808 type:complete len:682 (+) Transcript_53640:123-2168(+)
MLSFPSQSSSPSRWASEDQHIVAQAQVQIRSLRFALEQEQTKSNVAEARIASLERQLQQASLSSDKNLGQIREQEFEATLRQSEAVAAAASVEVKHLTAQLQEARNRNQSLQAELAELTEQSNFSADAAKREVRRYVDDLAEARKAVDALQTEANGLRQEVAREAAEHAETKCKCDLADAKLKALEAEVDELRNEASNLQKQCQQQKMQLQVSQEEHSKTLEDWKSRGVELLKATAEVQACQSRLDSLKAENSMLQDRWIQASSDSGKMRESAEDAANKLVDFQRRHGQQVDELRAQVQSQHSSLSEAASRVTKLEAELIGEDQALKEKVRLESELRRSYADIAEVREKSSAELAEAYATHAMELSKLREQQVKEFTNLRRHHSDELAALRADQARELESTKEDCQRQLQARQHREKADVADEVARLSARLAAEKDKARMAETLVKQLMEALHRSEAELKHKLCTNREASVSSSTVPPLRLPLAENSQLEDLSRRLRCRDEELMKKQASIDQMAGQLKEVTDLQSEVKSLRMRCEETAKEVTAEREAKQAAIRRLEATESRVPAWSEASEAKATSGNRTPRRWRQPSSSSDPQLDSQRRASRVRDRELFEQRIKALIDHEFDILHKYREELDDYMRFRNQAQDSWHDALDFEDMVAERLHGLAAKVEGRIQRSLRQLQHPQ